MALMLLRVSLQVGDDSLQPGVQCAEPGGLGWCVEVFLHPHHFVVVGEFQQQ